MKSIIDLTNHITTALSLLAKVNNILNLKWIQNKKTQIVQVVTCLDNFGSNLANIWPDWHLRYQIYNLIPISL